MKLKERVLAATFGFGFAILIVLIFESQQLMLTRFRESDLSK
jgi:hypothetical protein